MTESNATELTVDAVVQEFNQQAKAAREKADARRSKAQRNHARFIDWAKTVLVPTLAELRDGFAGKGWECQLDEASLENLISGRLPKVDVSFRVPDGVFRPFKISFLYLPHARAKNQQIVVRVTLTIQGSPENDPQQNHDIETLDPRAIQQLVLRAATNPLALQPSRSSCA